MHIIIFVDVVDSMVWLDPIDAWNDENNNNVARIHVMWCPTRAYTFKASVKPKPRLF